MRRPGDHVRAETCCSSSKIGTLEHAILVDVGDDIDEAITSRSRRSRVSRGHHLVSSRPRAEAWCREHQDRRRPGPPYSAIAAAGSTPDLRTLPGRRFTRRQRSTTRQPGSRRPAMPPDHHRPKMRDRPTMPASSSRLEPRPKAASRSTRGGSTRPPLLLATPGRPPRVAELAAGSGNPWTSLNGLPARDVDGRQGRSAQG